MRFLLVCLAATAAAQTLTPAHPFAATASVEPAAVAPGAPATLKVTLHIMEGGHANANTVADPNLIPTSFTPQPVAGIAWSAPKYPDPRTVTEWYSTEPLQVFRDGAVILVPFTVAATARPGDVTLSGTLQAQVCDHESCYRPGKVTVTASMKVR